LGTRGATEEAYRLRLPGTYLAGLFDKAPGEVTELPNLPDWLSVEIELAGERFDLTQGKILAYSRCLHLYDGVLVRHVRWQSPKGRISTLHFDRFVSISNNHGAALMVAVTPENYDGLIRFTSRLDGQVTNSGTQHFAPEEASTFNERGIYLISRTYEKNYLVAQGAEHQVGGEIIREGFYTETRRINYWAETAGKEGETCSLTKMVTTYSSRDLFLREKQPGQEYLLNLLIKASTEICRLGFEGCKKLHAEAWHEFWSRADIQIEGPAFDQLAIRFALFHLRQMASWDDFRVSIAAKGLSGEGYKGHVFWDTEIFIQPFFLHVFPKVAELQLKYRSYTLAGALRKAKENGYEGAMYPWESADTGDETTPAVGGIDIATKKPIPILSGRLQHHITADIAYAIARFVAVTGDETFLQEYGAEIVLLGARFWASRLTYNEAEGLYEINEVMGPDEYKENVNNNYYTNKMVQKHLLFAGKLAKSGRYSKLMSFWGFSSHETDQWAAIAAKIKLPRRGKLLEQFEGFLDLNRIDVEKYRKRPGWLQEDFSWREINEAQVIKQADVIMLFHLLPAEYTTEEKRLNWEFYEPKTMHDSSLSAAVHSVVASDLGLGEEAYQYFQKASRIDLGNELANSEHGLHAASLGGLWQAVVHGFGGVRIQGQKIHCRPILPREWSKLHFKIQFKQNLLGFKITKNTVTVTLLKACDAVDIKIGKKSLTLDSENPTVTTTYYSEEKPQGD
ncbi:MAG TPA: glycoside hydrolase family 65 protein, partial [Firmicutes bacterium]|nr:glycoside hydrolase family 65 protein [Bacillota bacterium]